MDLKFEVQKLVRERSKLEKVMQKGTNMAAAAFCRRKQGSAYLSVCIDGVNRTRYVKKEDEKEWQKLAQEWKTFWQAIARWITIGSELEKIFRKMGRDRLVALPEKKQRGLEE